MSYTRQAHVEALRLARSRTTRRLGDKLQSVDDAVSAGLLTDEEWCDILAYQRDAVQINRAAQGAATAERLRLTALRLAALGGLTVPTLRRAGVGHGRANQAVLALRQAVLVEELPGVQRAKTYGLTAKGRAELLRLEQST